MRPTPARSAAQLRGLALAQGLFMLSSGCSGSGSAEGGPPGPAAAPDAHAADTVIRVHYPAAGHPVAIRGDGGGLNWSSGQGLTQLDASTFEYRLHGAQAAFEFKPLIDDRDWSRGANYRSLPGRTVDLYPHFYTARGSWSRYWPVFHSNILNNDRGVWVYLPPSYGENPLGSFPVVYMHDGQNLFDPAYAFNGQTWQVQGAMDAGAETLDQGASIPEAIVVGPENTPNRIWEYTPTDGGYGGGGGAQYLRFLVEELKPVVDRQLRTQPGVAQTALIGSSLGGLITGCAGLTQGAVYGRVGLVSPSTWWDDRYLIGAVAGSAGQSPRPLRVYLDSGDSGPDNDDVDDTRDLAGTYRSIGYKDGVSFDYLVQAGGQHSEIYWAQRLPGALHFLLAP